MSKMNELAAVLDDLVTAVTHLKMCAQDLLTASNQLCGLYESADAEGPKPERKKPAVRKKADSEPGPDPEPPDNCTC